MYALYNSKFLRLFCGIFYMPYRRRTSRSSRDKHKFVVLPYLAYLLIAVHFVHYKKATWKIMKNKIYPAYNKNFLCIYQQIIRLYVCPLTTVYLLHSTITLIPSLELQVTENSSILHSCAPLISCLNEGIWIWTNTICTKSIFLISLHSRRFIV